MSLVDNIKIWPVSNGKTIKANGSFVVSDAFRVSFTVKEGKNGLFVSLPQERYEKDGVVKYADRVAPITREARTTMEEAVLTAYEKTMSPPEGEQGTAQGTTQGTGKSKNLPF